MLDSSLFVVVGNKEMSLVSFQSISRRFTEFTGSAVASVGACLSVVIWILGGIVYFGFGTEYQLVANSATTLITYCMVFIIQASQNRDTKALHAKLDELIHATQGAREDVMRIEEQTEDAINGKRLDPNC